MRRVFSSRSSPELGCLIPHVGVDTTCLYYVALPFDDDVRRFKLENFRLKLKPNEAQLKLIDDLIENMDLTPEEADEEEEEELYDPHTTFNPFIQRMFQSIALRATRPDAEIADFDHNLTSVHSTEIERRVKSDKVKELLKRCAEEFPTKVLTKKLKKQEENIFADKSKLDNDSVKEEQSDAANANLGLDEMLNSDDSKLSRVKRIGTITPVDDFKLLAERICSSSSSVQENDLEDLCMQMQALVKDFLNESMNQDDETSVSNSKLQEKAADCIRIQREYCLRLSMSSAYNAYLKAFKIYLLNLHSSKKFAKQIELFWEKYFSSLSLISNAECSTSDVSESESKQFSSAFSKDENSSESAQALNENETENVEDLLDMM